VRRGEVQGGEARRSYEEGEDSSLRRVEEG